MNERRYRSILVGRIQERFPGCLVLKCDPREIQGVPDILILYRERWAMLEIKVGSDSRKQPNQEYWVNFLNEISFASFINPENEEDVLSALQQSFRSVGETRLSES